MRPEPRFGDVYQWRATRQRVMVISDQPLAFVTLTTIGWPHGEIGEVTAFPSNEQKVPFSSSSDSWIRVEDE